MSKKLVKAANEKDQKSILKYTKVAKEECITHSEELRDTSALISTERCMQPQPQKGNGHKETHRTTVKAANQQSVST